MISFDISVLASQDRNIILDELLTNAKLIVNPVHKSILVGNVGSSTFNMPASATVNLSIWHKGTTTPGALTAPYFFGDGQLTLKFTTLTAPFVIDVYERRVTADVNGVPSVDDIQVYSSAALVAPAFLQFDHCHYLFSSYRINVATGVGGAAVWNANYSFCGMGGQFV